MGKRVKKAVKKIIKKGLDKTTVDEKVIEHVNENRSLYNKILWWIFISSRCWMFIRS